MEFMLPGRRKSDMILTAPPSAYDKLLIPFAISRHYTFPGGSYLSQEIKGSDFTIWQYHFFLHKPSLFYSYSSRPLLTLTYMLEGSATCLPQGSVEIKLEENRCRLLYSPAEVKNGAAFNSGNFMCIHINYDSAFLQKMIKKHLLQKPVVEKESYLINDDSQRLSSLVTRKVRMLLEEIISCKEAEPNRQLLFEARVRELLFIYIKDQDSGNYCYTKQSRIMDALTFYITEHLDQDLSLSALCRQAGISKTALQKISRDHRQKSIHRVVIDIRMAKAMELIATTDLSIGEIAAITTNKSFSYFSASFTLYFGRPPSYYRKKGDYPAPITNSRE